jgi:hypothetical protein
VALHAAVFNAGLLEEPIGPRYQQQDAQCDENPPAHVRVHIAKIDADTDRKL